MSFNESEVILIRDDVVIVGTVLGAFGAGSDRGEARHRAPPGGRGEEGGGGRRHHEGLGRDHQRHGRHPGQFRAEAQAAGGNHIAGVPGDGEPAAETGMCCSTV